MTARQMDFIRRLAQERRLPLESTAPGMRNRGRYVANLTNPHLAGSTNAATEPTTRQASAIIEWLLELPLAQERAPQQDETPDVPEGRFALRLNGDDQLRFFKVDRPEEGRWAGRTFLSEIFGGGFGDDGRREPIRDRARRTEILNAILAVGPYKAAQCYGIELGHCGRCGRTLTDETSRAFGIGPDCREAWGI